MIFIYKTNASRLIKLLFALVFVLFLVFSILGKSPALLIFTISIAILIIYLSNNTYYAVDQNSLVVNSSFLYNEKIPISTIKKLTPLKKNLLSGPGFSTNRIMIEYNENDCVIISPLLHEDFIRHLKRINPDIMVINRSAITPHGEYLNLSDPQ